VRKSGRWGTDVPREDNKIQVISGKTLGNYLLIQYTYSIGTHDLFIRF